MTTDIPQPSKEEHWIDHIEKMSLDELRNYVVSIEEDLDFCRSIKIPKLQKLLDEKEKTISLLRESEKKVSDAYLRIRKLLNAYDTPFAPMAEQVYETVERKLKELLSKHSAKNSEEKGKR